MVSIFPKITLSEVSYVIVKKSEITFSWNFKFRNKYSLIPGLNEYEHSEYIFTV